MGKCEKLQEIIRKQKWKRKWNILESFENFSENRNGSEQLWFVELQLAENFLRKQWAQQISSMHSSPLFFCHHRWKALTPQKVQLSCELTSNLHLMSLRAAIPAADPRPRTIKTRTLNHWCIVSTDSTNFHGNTPNTFFIPFFMWTLPTFPYTIFLLCTPPCCQDVRWQKALTHTPPMGVDGLPRPQLIKQDWHKYFSVFRTFRPSLPFLIYRFWWHLFDKWNMFDRYIWYKLKK